MLEDRRWKADLKGSDTGARESAQNACRMSALIYSTGALNSKSLTMIENSPKFLLARMANGAVPVPYGQYVDALVVRIVVVGACPKLCLLAKLVRPGRGRLLALTTFQRC